MLSNLSYRRRILCDISITQLNFFMTMNKRSQTKSESSLIVKSLYLHPENHLSLMPINQVPFQACAV